MYAEDEARLLRRSERAGAALDALVERRVRGEPLELILGWAAFGDRNLVVTAGVFVPRRRTLLLARMAAERATERSVVVELCCGVAPVASLVRAREVHVADISESALSCARTNAPHAVVHHGDLYDALPPALRGRVDVLAANAPYVPSPAIELMPPEARDHEPRAALDGGPDGIEVHRRIAAGAADWLRPGGVLLLETSRHQAALTRASMAAAGLTTEVVEDDEVGGCVAVGRLPVRPAAPE